MRIIAPAYFAPKRESVAVLARSTAFAAGLGSLAVIGLGLAAGAVFSAFGRAAMLP